MIACNHICIVRMRLFLSVSIIGIRIERYTMLLGEHALRLSQALLCIPIHLMPRRMKLAIERVQAIKEVEGQG